MSASRFASSFGPIRPNWDGFGDDSGFLDSVSISESTAAGGDQEGVAATSTSVGPAQVNMIWNRVGYDRDFFASSRASEPTPTNGGQESVAATSTRAPSPSIVGVARSISPEEVQSNAVIRKLFANRDASGYDRLMTRYRRIPRDKPAIPQLRRSKSPLSQSELISDENAVPFQSGTQQK